MKTQSHESDERSGSAADGARQEESASTNRRSPRRLISVWADRVLMIFIVGAGALGLAIFGSNVSRQRHEAQSEDRGGSGVIVWSATTDAWLPRSLIDLAKNWGTSESTPTHDDFKRVLEHENLQDAWYALIKKSRKANGASDDLLFIRHPWRDADHHVEMLAILKAAAGTAGTEPSAEPATLSIHVLPVELLKNDPAKIMTELLGLNAPGQDTDRAGSDGE